MGASLSTPFKSQRAFDRTTEFMEEHYRSWNEVAKDHPELQSYRNGTYLSENVWCGDREFHYGFDYSGGLDCEYAYRFAIVSWLAIKAGRRAKTRMGGEYGITVATPYYLYDAYEATPVLTANEWGDMVNERGKLCKVLCDSHGFKPIWRPYKTKPDGTPKEIAPEGQEYVAGRDRECGIIDRLISEEVQRLSALWTKEKPLDD
jgi:hypothetical protein